MRAADPAARLGGGELEAQLAGGSLLGLTSLRHRSAELVVGSAARRTA